jgi:hypothetical protein
VSERLRRGALAGGLAVELIHDLKIKPHYPAKITGFRGRIPSWVAGPRIELPTTVPQNPLEFYTEGIFCQ